MKPLASIIQSPCHQVSPCLKWFLFTVNFIFKMKNPRICNHSIPIPSGFSLLEMVSIHCQFHFLGLEYFDHIKRHVPGNSRGASTLLRGQWSDTLKITNNLSSDTQFSVRDSTGLVNIVSSTKEVIGN